MSIFFKSYVLHLSSLICSSSPSTKCRKKKEKELINLLGPASIHFLFSTLMVWNIFCHVSFGNFNKKATYYSHIFSLSFSSNEPWRPICNLIIIKWCNGFSKARCWVLYDQHKFFASTPPPDPNFLFLSHWDNLIYIYIYIIKLFVKLRRTNEHRCLVWWLVLNT